MGRLKSFLSLVKTTRFALAAAWIFLVFLALFSLKTSSDVHALVQEREIEQEAGDRQQVDSCIQRAVQAPALQRVLNALPEILPDEKAREDARNFARVSKENTPTLADCRALASRLGVDDSEIPGVPQR